MTADEAVRSRSPVGVTDHEMTSGWRVIVARHEHQSRTWYYHQNDDWRHKADVRKIADDWWLANQ